MAVRHIVVALLVLPAFACEPKIEPQLCVTGVEVVCASFEVCDCPPPEGAATAVQVLYREAIQTEAHSATVTVRGPCTSNVIEVPIVDQELRIVRPLPLGAACFFSVAVESLGTTTSAQFSGGLCDETAAECIAEGEMDASIQSADAGDM